MFIPTTAEEIAKLGWSKLDIILVTGDTYIDSPYFGSSVIGHVLIDRGYKVGIIAQPDIDSPDDIKRLGEPALFWGVTSGSVDSMISNYTASNKRRNDDDLTPGGKNTKRPDRALIVYTNLIRRYFKKTVPVVLGGIEASMRRIAHYDFKDNTVRRSILFDAKADILVYGMGEASILELAEAIKKGEDFRSINGICYIDKIKKSGYIELPSFEEVGKNKKSFIKMYNEFYSNNDPVKGKGLFQKHNDRYLVHNPLTPTIKQNELDYIYNLPYERDAHPFYKKQGRIRALDTIRFSITTHRGCFGECSFCAIALHQGRRVVSRSKVSILEEAAEISKHREFKGIINDLGGPSANMYGFGCGKRGDLSSCKGRHCIYPIPCKHLKGNHRPQIDLLKNMRDIEGIKKIFVSSGLRYDLVLNDKKFGNEYIELLAKHHVSGQLKVAPEHSEGHVLDSMCKPAIKSLIQFKSLFEKINKAINKKQFLTYYFIAAHPSCTMKDMNLLKRFIKKELKMNPEQVQIFTPSPSTYSTLMYYTGINPFTGSKIFVERDPGKKEKQKRTITGGAKK